MSLCKGNPFQGISNLSNTPLDFDNPLDYPLQVCLTLVELPEYVRDADRLLDEQSQEELKDFLARNHKAGRIMQGTGGIRKLRWARPGAGKSGGVRVI